MHAVRLKSNIAQNFSSTRGRMQRRIPSSCEHRPQSILLSVFACTRWPSHTLQSLHIQKNFHKVCEVMIRFNKLPFWQSLTNALYNRFYSQACSCWVKLNGNFSHLVQCSPHSFVEHLSLEHGYCSALSVSAPPNNKIIYKGHFILGPASWARFQTLGINQWECLDGLWMGPRALYWESAHFS